MHKGRAGTLCPSPQIHFSSLLDMSYFFRLTVKTCWSRKLLQKAEKCPCREFKSPWSNFGWAAVVDGGRTDKNVYWFQWMWNWAGSFGAAHTLRPR